MDGEKKLASLHVERKASAKEKLRSSVTYLRVHEIRLFTVYTEELCVEFGKILDFTGSRWQAVQAFRPSSFVLGDHVYIVEQILGQLVQIVRLRKTTRNAGDYDILRELRVTEANKVISWIFRMMFVLKACAT